MKPTTKKKPSREEQVEAARQAYSVWWTWMMGTVEMLRHQASQLAEEMEKNPDHPMWEVVHANLVHNVSLDCSTLSTELLNAMPLVKSPPPLPTLRLRK